MENPACAVCGSRTKRHAHLGGYPIVRCVGCSHCQACVRDPDALPADYERLYADGVYRRSLVDKTRSSLGVDWSKFQTYRPFFERIHPSADLSVLDVACGTGRFVNAAAKAGFTVCGSDTSETAVEVGREVFPGIDLAAMPLEMLAAGGRRYAVVTAFEFVEHTSRPPQTIASLLELVEPGGRIFLTVPNWNSAAVRGATQPEWQPPIHLQFFTRRSLHRLLTGHPYIEPSTVSIGFIPPRPLFPPSSWLKGREPDGLFAIARVKNNG